MNPNEHFLSLIREIETALRTRLGNRRSQRAGFAEMIEDYRERNPYWQREAEDLDILREQAARIAAALKA